MVGGEAPRVRPRASVNEATGYALLQTSRDGDRTDLGLEKTLPRSS
jgi:hypothetical protein